MSWYSKYLSVYEKSMSELPEDLLNNVRIKLASIQNNTPWVSVVLIAHNEESRLLSCLWSLSDNICKYPLEIIGVDNNSSDGTVALFEKLGIRCYQEKKKGPGHARQCGLDHALGKYYLCIDSDTMYPPYYIETMVNKLQKPGVAGVTALWSFIRDENHSGMGLYLYEMCRDINLYFLSIKRPELVVRGMVFGFQSDLARKYGFRTDIIRGEDGTLANRLKNDGKIIFTMDRKARALTGHGTLGKDGSLWNAFAVRVFSHLKYLRSYFRKANENDYKDRPENMIEP